MRKRFEQQMTLGRLPISETDVPTKKRNGALPGLCAAMKEIFITPKWNEKVFEILESKITESKKHTGRAVGPFKMVEDTIDITISGKSEINIKVLPNVRLRATLVSVTGTTATVMVTYEKVQATESLTQLAVIWSQFNNPNMLTFAGGSTQVQSVSSEGLTSGERTFTITGLTNGTKYYLRAAGRTNAAGNYYNYSKTISGQNN